ncbi:hypothetical protein Tco_0971136 [Tanacetum coccineum]
MGLGIRNDTVMGTNSITKSQDLAGKAVEFIVKRIGTYSLISMMIPLDSHYPVDRSVYIHRLVDLGTRSYEIPPERWDLPGTSISSIHYYRLSHSELDDIEKVAVCSSLRLLNTKNALLKILLCSRARGLYNALVATVRLVWTRHGAVGRVSGLMWDMWRRSEIRSDYQQHEIILKISRTSNVPVDTRPPCLIRLALRHATKYSIVLSRFTQSRSWTTRVYSDPSPPNKAGDGIGAAGYGGAQNRVGNANPGQARQVKCYNYNGVRHIARNCTQPKRQRILNTSKDRCCLMQAQENGVALDEEQLLFIAGGQDNAIDEDVDEQPVQDLALNVDNVFQADDCDAFDSDVDEAPTAQTMFMANLSSADPVYDEAGPSYDSDILSEVHDHDHYQDAVCEHHEEHEMHDDVQPNYVVDSHANYTSDSNMIPYDQYVKDNAVPVVQSNVSSVPNDAYMMIFNDMHEPHAQSVSDTTRNTVVDNSLTAELATYKEQVELYERRARFELTEREQKIDEQLRIVITDRNIKEENLKKELHSVKMQLASTINHNKSMVEEVTSLKKDFKQKENKYLEEFLDMKALKEKVEDKLYKQDQSLQTVHMLCKPKPYYNEQNKVAIGYKNPLCLTRAKQVQPALYNGYEIIKNNHVPALVHNTEDTLEIAEITKRKMNDKMKDPECVTHKVKITPPDYSKRELFSDLHITEAIDP